MPAPPRRCEGPPAPSAACAAEGRGTSPAPERARKRVVTSPGTAAYAAEPLEGTRHARTLAAMSRPQAWTAHPAPQKGTRGRTARGVAWASRDQQHLPPAQPTSPRGTRTACSQATPRGSRKHAVLRITTRAGQPSRQQAPPAHSRSPGAAAKRVCACAASPPHARLRWARGARQPATSA